MAAKRMTSQRIDGQLADRIERLAHERGETRSAFTERALAREALRASGAARPHPVHDPVEEQP